MPTNIDDSLPVSSYIDIAPNEYVTKYSFNRNFEKLLSNDYWLYEKYGIHSDDELNIQTYNKLRTYDAGEIVFYKIQKSDTKFYMLSSIQGPNTHKPTVRKNLQTNELYVINSDWWVIVGAKDTSKGTSLPKDDADQYVNESRLSFQSNHELETDDPSAHPTGELGLQKSEKVFKSMENIDPDRKKVFYPSYLQSLVADQTILAGYMRKWDNGLLEYDMTFRLGYLSTDQQGLDILSANNFIAEKTPNNFLYFKNAADYSIFNIKSENFSTTPRSKQLNLNDSINAYVGKIEFPEHFKDLNYMVFTSNMKCLETEAYSLHNDIIEDYDARLIIDGLALAGIAKDAAFTRPCTIPNQIVNIKSYALANIEQVENLPVVFNMSPWESNLVNINAYAFFGTGIETIDIPASVRYIGPHAFENCTALTCVNFYVYRNDIHNQVRIDRRAFSSSVKRVNIYYKQKASFGAAQPIVEPSHEDAFLNDIDLYNKIYGNPDYRVWIGFPYDVQVRMYEESATASRLMATKSIDASVDVIDVVENANQQTTQQDTSNVFTIGIADLLAEVPQSSSMKMAKMHLAAPKPAIDINKVFKMSGTVLTGYDASSIDGLIGFNLDTMATKPTSIQTGALHGFTQLTSLTLNSGLTSVYPNAFDTALKSIALKTAASKSYKLSIDIPLDILDINFAEQPTSFALSIANALDNLYILGTAVPSQSISARYIENVNVNSVPIIKEKAFYNISGIGTCTIESQNTQLQAGIFNAILMKDSEENDYYYSTVNALNLVGNRFDIKSGALSGIDIPYLSIDLNGTHISGQALLSSSIDVLTFTNSPEIFSSVFSNACFDNCEILQIGFNVPINDLTSNANKLNTSKASDLKLPNNVLVKGTDGSRFLSANPYSYNDATRYFNYNAANQISSYTNSLTADDIEDLVIPYGATGILDNVFNATAHTELNTKIDIGSIHIPSTVKHIGNNAFKGLSSLYSVASDPGTELTSLGTNVFQACKSLRLVNFKH